MLRTEKKFNDKKQYEFIEIGREEDIFVHYSAIDLDGYKTLSESELVRYELKTLKGLQTSSN